MLGGDLTSCPACGGVIRLQAQICKHCMVRVAEHSTQIRWEGDLGIVPTEAVLTSHRCGLCGTDRSVRPMKKAFVWSPPWVVLGILATVVGLLLLYFLTRRAGRLTLPVCDECRRDWRRSQVISGATVLFGLFLFPMLGALMGTLVGGNETVALGAFAGLAGWVAAVVVVQKRVVVPNQVRPRRIDRKHMWLAFPSIATARDVFSENETGTGSAPEPPPPQEAPGTATT